MTTPKLINGIHIFSNVPGDCSIRLRQCDEQSCNRQYDLVKTGGITILKKIENKDFLAFMLLVLQLHIGCV